MHSPERFHALRVQTIVNRVTTATVRTRPAGPRVASLRLHTYHCDFKLIPASVSVSQPVLCGTVSSGGHSYGVIFIVSADGLELSPLRVVEPHFAHKGTLLPPSTYR